MLSTSPASSGTSVGVSSLCDEHAVRRVINITKNTTENFFTLLIFLSP
jgi:hypothetical protein